MLEVWIGFEEKRDVLQKGLSEGVGRLSSSSNVSKIFHAVSSSDGAYLDQRRWSDLASAMAFLFSCSSFLPLRFVRYQRLLV